MKSQILKNVQIIGETGSMKLSRRDFVKATGAGALYLAMPNLAISDEIKLEDPPKDTGEEPLVILAKNKELRWFRGFDERVLNDKQLVERFTDSIEDSIVIFAKDNRVIEFRGLEEFVIEDTDLRSLSNKFNAGG